MMDVALPLGGAWAGISDMTLPIVQTNAPTLTAGNASWSAFCSGGDVTRRPPTARKVIC